VYQPVVVFDTAQARIITATDTFSLRIDVAEREDQRAYGLMERTQLPDDAGMVFLYQQEQPAENGFWMWRTRIALDIAFFDGDGAIVTIRSMEPCSHADPRGCPTYPPGVPYHGALEVNRGYFAARGITTGDRIVVVRLSRIRPTARPGTRRRSDRASRGRCPAARAAHPPMPDAAPPSHGAWRR
jgi:uncharacterized protein